MAHSRTNAGYCPNLVQEVLLNAYGSQQLLREILALGDALRASAAAPTDTSVAAVTTSIPPVPPLDSQRFMTYGELKAKVEMDREAGTKTMGAIYMAMCKLCKPRSISIYFVTFFSFLIQVFCSSSSGFFFGWGVYI